MKKSVKPIIEIGNGLYCIEDAFDIKECLNITSILSDVETWTPGLVLNKHTKLPSISNIRKQSCINYVENMDNRIGIWLKNFYDFGKSFCPTFGLSLYRKAGLLAYQQSVVGDFFEWHSDTNADLDRKLSVMCYLSDSDTNGLIGGNTEFIIDGEVISIEPKAGTVIAFNPNIIHRGAIVNAGIKYCSLCIYE